MKNTASHRFIGHTLAVSTLVIFFGALASPHSLNASASSVTESAPRPNLDAEKALALAKAYAEKKKIDFSQFENGVVRMERRKDTVVYWIVSYKKIVAKNEPIVPGTDRLLFTVDDETKEVRRLPGM